MIVEEAIKKLDRRIFLKTAGVTLFLSSPVLAMEQKNQWINIDTQKPPLNKEIVILKYVKDIDPECPRNVATFFVGKIVERKNETMVYIMPKASYTIVENRDKEDYYRIQKNVNYDKKIEQFIVENYAKGRCRQDDYYWWTKKKNQLTEWLDPKKIRIGFHMLNSDKMRTYWAPVNRLPKQLP